MLDAAETLLENKHQRLGLGRLSQSADTCDASATAAKACLTRKANAGGQASLFHTSRIEPPNESFNLQFACDSRTCQNDNSLNSRADRAPDFC